MTNTPPFQVRRHADGALDLDHYRRRGRRRRQAALRLFWRTLFRAGSRTLARCRPNLTAPTPAADPRRPSPAAAAR